MRIPSFLAFLLPLAAGMANASPYSAAISADAPVAWWRFEEVFGSVAVDSAGSFAGQHIGVTLTLPSAFPGLGTAGGFDGTASTVDVPAIGTFTDLSIEAWVKVDTLPASWVSLYNTDLFNGDSSHWQLIGNFGGTAAVMEWALGFGDLNNGQSFATDTWYHIVTTYNAASGDGLLYVNGALAETMFNVPGKSIALTDGYLGSWNGNSRFLDGQLDEVAIYGATLSPAQVQAHYAAAQVSEPLSAGLLLAGAAALGAMRRRQAD